MSSFLLKRDRVNRRVYHGKGYSK